MVRTSTAPVQARARATRKKLLDATITTLTNRGYAATSMPELCKCAQLSRGAQLHHFPTKASLLAAAVEHLMDLRHEELRTALRRQPSTPDDFADVLWSIYSGDTFYAWLELAIASRTDPELWKHLVEVNDRFYDKACDTLAEFLPVERASLPVLARFLTSFFDGVAVNRIMDSDEDMSLQTVEMFKEVMRAWFAAHAKEEEA